MTTPEDGETAFSPPPRTADETSPENAVIEFEPRGERLTEQADPTEPPGSSAETPAPLLDVRGALEEVLRRQGRPSVMQSVEVSGSDLGNIQGVGIGLGEPGVSGEPGARTVAVFVVEPVPTDQVRAMVVDSLGIQAAGDLPISVHRSGIIDAQPHRFALRPAPGGVSVGHFRITAGTLGCLAVGRTPPRTDRLLMLSNNHVIANSNDAAFGDCISQPGPADGGLCPADQIATTERFVPIRYDGTTNYVDCATGWCRPDQVRRELVHRSGGTVQYFRISDSPLSPQLGWNVGKSGRTTQLTSGRITALNWSGWINYGPQGQAWFSGQFVVEGHSGTFSAGGDSGSVVWTWDATRHPVGLLFAGGGGYTICNPMPEVVSALDINLYT